MASLNSVKTLEVYQVTPALDSPQSSTEFSLPFTYFDIEWLTFPPAQCLYFFKLNDSSATPSFFHSVIFPRLKQSLSQTLLHFLPLAGRTSWPPNAHKPIIIYSPNDALSLTLAESNANFDRLSGRGILRAIESCPYIPELLSSESVASPLALQITFFPSAGFCIGMTQNHTVLDGKSSSMFINAWAYICRNIEYCGDIPTLLPELTPYLDRTVISDPAGLESAYLLATTADGVVWNPGNLKWRKEDEVEPNLLRATFQLPRDALNKLKNNVLRYQQARLKCTEKLHLSSYVLTCSHVFVSLIKAMGADSNRKVCLMLPVDCRHRLKPQVPQNYFGNCLLGYYVAEEAGAFMEENGVAVMSEKLSDVIKELDRDPFKGAIERFVALRNMGPEVLMLGVAGWPRTGFYGLDFGWGSVEKVEITHIHSKGAFSIMEMGDGREGTEIGVVLTPQEMESFVSLFFNGLKVIQSRV